MTKKVRRIPYGTMNWELIVRECHFVDNTAYIRRLENCRAPVFAKHALLVEFKCFTAAETDRQGVLGRPTPDAETAEQALAYVKAVTAKPDWGNVPLDAVVVEVCSDRGYNWIPVGV